MRDVMVVGEDLIVEVRAGGYGRDGNVGGVSKGNSRNPKSHYVDVPMSG